LAVEVFTNSFIALEAGAFVVFLGLVVEDVFGDEFDFPDFVIGSAFGGSEDGEETPVGFVDGFFQADFQVACAGVGVVGCRDLRPLRHNLMGQHRRMFSATRKKLAIGIPSKSTQGLANSRLRAHRVHSVGR
jgi:hypothetical protein